mmetsp:Transcript_7236/g.13722  ORF Transcript_7236/g.13722 Transcript_7236/m.13722 type:complete len:363 (+) Transcript_7236:31-1119(+)|eukprot:CAMPEP_0175150778 /NCGR_PEP_ID=MMETSP0087-20121206/18086_1 /TAXON_ID=136419 /ORGANISM="Unknown Unknown, Strain D1" /LENGTH=362 /DNA_ID=CAMNT_0016436815 /DNA_START=31 /DNA_END=1119 /DNA_ORIENTATION=+
MQSYFTSAIWRTSTEAENLKEHGAEIIADKENQSADENQTRDVQFEPSKDGSRQQLLKIEKLESQNADLEDRLEEAEERVRELEVEVAMLDESDSTSRAMIQRLEEEKAELVEQIKQTADPAKLKELEDAKKAMQEKIEGLEQKVQRLEKINTELSETRDTQAVLIGQLMEQLNLYQRRRSNGQETPGKLQALKAAKKYVDTLLRLEEAEKCAQPKFASKDSWQQDNEITECNSCDKKFGAFNRRHHCRLCGNIFCGHCAPRTTMNAFQDISSAQASQTKERTCHGCAKKASDASKQLSKLEMEKFAREKHMQSAFAEVNIDCSDTDEENDEEELSEPNGIDSDLGRLVMSPVREVNEQGFE